MFNYLYILQRENFYYTLATKNENDIDALLIVWIVGISFFWDPSLIGEVLENSRAF